MSQPKAPGAKAPPHAHYWKPCALEMRGWFFGGRGLGIQTAIQTVLYVHRESEATSWEGFTIEMPLGKNNEDDGFGVTQRYRSRPSPPIITKFEVRFPIGSRFIVQEISEGTLAKLPKTDKKMSLLEVHSEERPTVRGFGMPFANPGHPNELQLGCRRPLRSPRTHSKRNPDQVANALDFLADMVKTGRFKPADFAIITPYAANVGLTERLRERAEYAILLGMPPTATVDSFQGREAGIMVVIMGTTEEVGPGFTTDAHRLKVMLSRQRSGLLVFGDINVVETPEPAPGPASGRGGRGGRGGNYVVEHNGVRKLVRDGMLQQVLKGWKTAGRVIMLPPRPKAKSKATAVPSQQTRVQAGPSSLKWSAPDW
ncbi:hypothetical protein HDV57DRAFT_508130 [Trichoderma longibrachiatum]|uniref:DNA2/NAM7 helicase-like C-terminal domain-containing protein n=1 Tax=Trichoderma longibrachiatum ATCC 18648 TaxID=983965 RepID=A0A2T4BR68_TRILO|nr:hypothetical protein M440DRAFT_1426146 [Trichoderma longibrachiatum ATCC 18648]